MCQLGLGSQDGALPVLPAACCPVCCLLPQFPHLHLSPRASLCPKQIQLLSCQSPQSPRGTPGPVETCQGQNITAPHTTHEVRAAGALVLSEETRGSVMTVRATVAATRELPAGSTAVPLSPQEVEPDCQAPVVWDSKKSHAQHCGALLLP